MHGSQASLLSGGSSLYGSTEERQANEVRRLKRELLDAREQVMSLSSQLSTNVSTNSFFIDIFNADVVVITLNYNSSNAIGFDPFILLFV